MVKDERPRVQQIAKVSPYRYTKKRLINIGTRMKRLKVFLPLDTDTS